MKITQQNIRMLLQTNAEKGLTENELLQRLNQKKKKQALLKKALARLIRTDQCLKLNQRYFLQPKSPTKPKRRKPTPEIGQRSKSSRSKHPKTVNGVVLYKSNKQTVYSFSEDEEFDLDREHATNLFHGDLVRYKLMHSANNQSIAYITSVVERKIKTIIGKIKSSRKKQSIVAPINRIRFPWDFVTRSTLAKEMHPGDNIALAVTNYPGRNRLPEGKIIGRLSKNLFEMPAMNDILAQKRILTRFPEKVQKAAVKIPMRVVLKKTESRTDLRDIPFITMDGKDAQDFDDAIFAEKQQNKYRLWVSIADVADYVKPGTTIDNEAQMRGTSTYLPGAVFPMLPEMLSNGLCSLKTGLNRKTITCEMLIDESGKELEFKIYESMIRVSNRLTYEAVDEFYEIGSFTTGNSTSDLTEKLNLYRKIALVLEKKRKKRGAIEFNLAEAQYEYDKENNIVDIRKRFQTTARRVIEQFMLEANESVARYCQKNKIPIVWRNHPPPLQSNINGLKQLLRRTNFGKPRLRTSKDYNLLLKESSKTEIGERLSYRLLRSMTIAVYDTRCQGHFGLAAPTYCHFTSPIRRYPDLLVHRALKNHWAGRKSGMIGSNLTEYLTDREKLSAAAERASEKLAKTVFMARYVGDVFDVKIISFQWNGLYVEIDHPYVEGFVPLKTIWEDTYAYDERIDSIVGSKNRNKVRIGKRFKAILTQLDLRHFYPELEWLCWIDERA